MAADDAGQGNRTADLLINSKRVAHYDKPAALIRIETTGPAYDWTTSEVDYSLQLNETGYNADNRADTLVETGDRVGMLSIAGESPQLIDKIMIDGERYAFTDLQRIAPGAEVLVYTFVAQAPRALW